MQSAPAKEVLSSHQNHSCSKFYSNQTIILGFGAVTDKNIRCKYSFQTGMFRHLDVLADIFVFVEIILLV